MFHFVKGENVMKEIWVEICVSDVGASVSGFLMYLGFR